MFARFIWDRKHPLFNKQTRILFTDKDNSKEEERDGLRLSRTVL